ncbi:hypothetical protein PVL29_022116 [Vitis rotundifolia]|uniref:Pre-mRNA-processing factor 19 n=1 Tax=Vitis rotundifolia TaxID=103349 RepID=A0AA38YUW6_VITRO|nr:hypothetical protein PVL29_022116 [Vitis rotundifolia]
MRGGGGGMSSVKGGGETSSIPTASKKMSFLHLKHPAMPVSMVDVIFSDVAVAGSKTEKGSIDRKRINDAGQALGVVVAFHVQRKRATGGEELGPNGKKLRPGISASFITELIDCNAALSRQRKKRQIPTSLAPIGAVEGVSLQLGG